MTARPRCSRGEHGGGAAVCKWQVTYRCCAAGPRLPAILALWVAAVLLHREGAGGDVEGARGVLYELVGEKGGVMGPGTGLHFV